MNRYPHVVFDLDGTLSNPKEGVFNAYQYTEMKMGLEVPPAEKLFSLIGPPLQQGFMDVYGLSGERLMEAVKCFREYYGEKGLYENRMYDGIPELLKELSHAGVSTYVATSKYELYARRVLEHFGILSLFTDVAGADYNGVQASKVGLVLQLLQRNGITDPDGVVIVGDTRFDIETAAELEIDCIGVSYGFSSLEEIERLNPEFIAGSVGEVRKVLLGY
jgi:phosphoglycolate phosphatase